MGFCLPDVGQSYPIASVIIGFINPIPITAAQSIVDSNVNTQGVDVVDSSISTLDNNMREAWIDADMKKERDSRVMIVFGKHCGGNSHVLTKWSKASRGCTCFAFPLGMIDLEDPPTMTKLRKLGCLSFICIYIDLPGCEESYVHRVSELCRLVPEVNAWTKGSFSMHDASTIHAAFEAQASPIA